MPNWCECDMAIYAKDNDKEGLEKLKRLKQDIDKAMEIAKLEHKWDLYQIFETCGKFKKDEILNGNLSYIRGTIYNVDLEEEMGQNGVIFIYYESAWGPMIEGWNNILAQYDLEQVTRCEECGCQVYINTDIEGRFFLDRYKLDLQYKGEPYCEYFSEYGCLVSYCEDLFKIKLKGLKFEDLQRKLGDLVEDDNEDNWFTLEEFCEE